MQSSSSSSSPLGSSRHSVSSSRSTRGTMNKRSPSFSDPLASGSSHVIRSSGRQGGVGTYSPSKRSTTKISRKSSNRKSIDTSSNTKVTCSLRRLQLRVPVDLVEKGCEDALKEWVWSQCQEELKQALSVSKNRGPALVEEQEDDDDDDDDDDDLSLAASVHSKASVRSKHSRGGGSSHNSSKNNHRNEVLSDGASRHLAVLSSEIKTPLTNAINMAAAMTHSSGISDFEHKSMQAFQKGGEDLLEIVNESLEYSKLWSGGMELRMASTSLQETFSNVMQAVENMAAVGNVGIDTCFDASLPAFVKTDGRLVTEILKTLLENAIQQCQYQGRVKLGVSAVSAKDILPASEICSGEEYETFLRFVIKDSGKGVAKDQLGRIFEPFYNGSGVGMAIASKLIEDLRGILQVKSKVGGSTTITVDLPVGGNPVDTSDFARKFQDATVFIVGNDPRDNLFLHMLAKYRVDMVKLDSCGDMEALVQSKKAIDRNRIYVCLIQENLYRVRSYERLAQDASSVLLTFGSNRSVPEAKTHFHSLTRVLPCVIAKSIIACLEVIRMNQNSSVRRAPSMKVPRLKSFDYSNVRVLIAEDNRINQKILQRMLRRKGVKHIDVVDDGQQAVDSIHLHKLDYDIIFMDNFMPKMDGIEACQLILGRKDEGRKMPEIAFVTANLSETFKREALRAGGNGFIVKPFTAEAIETYFHSQTRLTSLVTAS